MAEISYKDRQKLFKDLQNRTRDAKGAVQVFLLFGEELLCKTALEEIKNLLIGDADPQLNYEPFDGQEADIFEIIERLNTYALLAGSKVIALIAARVFDSQDDSARLLEKSKAAYDAEDLRTAAKHFLRLVSALNLELADLQGENLLRQLQPNTDDSADDQWPAEVARYCTDNGLKPPAGKDAAGALQQVIEKGFPPGHFLLITADKVLKRHSLYKTIFERGMVVDCSVPLGERKSDRTLQDAVLSEQMQAVLSAGGKSMEKDAFSALVEMTGFDLRMFSSNLEKLISYIGTRSHITRQDVESILLRTKKDPLYEFTGALGDRDLQKALHHLRALMSSGFFPLQILAAMTNQVRKLLLAKDFVQSPGGKAWRKGASYGHFTGRTLPAVLANDEALAERLATWEAAAVEGAEEKRKTRGPKAKGTGKSKTDLFLAKTAKNPYPVYQLLLKCDKYSLAELQQALRSIREADLSLKTTPQPAAIILEAAVFKICQPHGH